MQAFVEQLGSEYIENEESESKISIDFKSTELDEKTSEKAKKQEKKSRGQQSRCRYRTSKKRSII